MNITTFRIFWVLLVNYQSNSEPGPCPPQTCNWCQKWEQLCEPFNHHRSHWEKPCAQAARLQWAQWTLRDWTTTSLDHSWSSESELESPKSLLRIHLQVLVGSPTTLWVHESRWTPQPSLRPLTSINNADEASASEATGISKSGLNSHSWW